ncbi:MAG: aminotransferase class IV [Brevundimonas sp.]|uniref:aminotransferase class IV n=1 Tax=Brevundimonas sp. TaxID=1871086 RepID=UPI00391A1B95
MLTLLVNGAPAERDDLLHLALVNYGAFTSMQAVEGADSWGVRGLDLHLARLRDSGVELFGQAPGEGEVRGWIRQALKHHSGAASVRVNLFSRAISVRDPSSRGAPDVMVLAGPPAPEIAGPLKLGVSRYQREAPHLKHGATFGLIRERREALAGGHDDVLFADENARITEGSIWNIGFLKGDTVVWPQGPMLAGTGQALLQRGLEAVDVTTDQRWVGLPELPDFDAAFIVNAAIPAAGVSAIGPVRYAGRPDLMQLLRNAWRSNPCQPL